MVNWIWLFFIVVSVVVAAITGKMDTVTQAAFEGAKSGVTVSFGLISIMVFWLGMMRIAEDAGLLKKLARMLRPIVRWLFPDIPKDHPAIGYIMSNLSANLFGLGNAATPMGIKAMQELQKLNPNKDTATPAMCTLLALNTSSITIIPTTLIAIRMNYGSANPAEIIGTTIAATIVATAAAIAADRWYRNRSKLPPLAPPTGKTRNNTLPAQTSGGGELV
ncbi:nucleoside recognition protein [Paenibacillus sp. GSMTC-2017]|uniref:nucleoside recognition domain-containing protein n=1 Tax=Paenibacillus sp. GSMTC-2017 TaxID=2794350 RepID=UPI0018D8F0BE|nr:nucleoside recognition domain-containing protein [Paenibacillus sp. GSMTC-2017]MBH5318002.1 nucleoside recognition protein [Paenibacillus sp. GSMTC-2017]